MPAETDPVDLAINWVRRIANQRGIESIDCATPRTRRVDARSKDALQAFDPTNDIDTITFRFKLPDT